MLQAQISALQDDTNTLLSAVLTLNQTAMFTTNAYEVGASCLNGQVIFLPGETITTGDINNDQVLNDITFAFV